MSISQFTPDDLRCIDEAYTSLMKVAAKRCKDKAEVETVRKAFKFANQAHKDVRRRSGEPYILHPIAVAEIVVSEIGLGCKSICAALLHDVVEDTAYTVEDIRNLFGDKISTLVDGLTKIKTVLDNEDRKGEAASTESLQAENFKRILKKANALDKPVQIPANKTRTITGSSGLMPSANAKSATALPMPALENSEINTDDKMTFTKVKIEKRLPIFKKLKINNGIFKMV